MQVAEKARVEQPQVHHRFEVLERQHHQLFAVGAAFQQRSWHQAQPHAIGHQPELQFGAEGFQIDLHAQALIGQRPLQTCAKTAAVRVEHPALLVTICQLAGLFGTEPLAQTTTSSILPMD